MSQSLGWVVYSTTTDLENYPSGIYRLVGSFKTPQEAWAYQSRFGGEGVFMLEPPLEEPRRMQ